MAQYISLYSGSSGNCSIVSDGQEHLLIDLGKNCKQVCLALEQVGVSPRDIQGILITHEHSDHIGAIKVFLKKYKIPIYATSATADYLIEYGFVPDDIEVISLEGRAQNIGSFLVEAFPTSHDSVDCCGFRIQTEKSGCLSIATDLGEVSEQVYQKLVGADLVVLEANYDITMLTFGPYPYHLKTRIKSNRGHLCNDDTAIAICRLATDGCKRFALCHLSNENNTPLTALDAVHGLLVKNGVCTADELLQKQILVTTNKRNSLSQPIEF